MYIGQTTNTLEDRIKKHYFNSRCSKYKSYLFHAFKKYGNENFKLEIIDHAESKKELDDKEIYWIEFYNTLNHEFGYNLKTGGANGKPCQESINKMKESAKRNRDLLSDEERKEKYGAHHNGKLPWIAGKKHTEETREKMSNARKGKPSWNKGLYLSDEHKENLSKSHKEMIKSLSGKEKKEKFGSHNIGHIPWNKNKSWDIETKIKIALTLSPKELTESIVRDIKNKVKIGNIPYGYWKQYANENKLPVNTVYNIVRNTTWSFLEV